MCSWMHSLFVFLHAISQVEAAVTIGYIAVCMFSTGAK